MIPTDPSASIVWDLDYDWGDAEWMSRRWERNGLMSPISIYEVHLGSWKRIRDEGNRPLSYKEAAVELVAGSYRIANTAPAKRALVRRVIGP